MKVSDARLPRGVSRESLVLGVFTVLLVAAVLAGSLLPPHYKAVLHTRGRFHSWLHVISFGALAFVAARTTRSTMVRALLFLGALAFGFGIEVVEHITYRAAVEWRDVLADAIGISVATLLALLLDR